MFSQLRSDGSAVSYTAEKSLTRALSRHWCQCKWKSSNKVDIVGSWQAPETVPVRYLDDSVWSLCRDFVQSRPRVVIQRFQKIQAQLPPYSMKSNSRFFSQGSFFRLFYCRSQWRSRDFFWGWVNISGVKTQSIPSSTKTDRITSLLVRNRVSWGENLGEGDCSLNSLILATSLLPNDDTGDGPLVFGGVSAVQSWRFRCAWTVINLNHFFID